MKSLITTLALSSTLMAATFTQQDYVKMTEALPDNIYFGVTNRQEISPPQCMLTVKHNNGRVKFKGKLPEGKTFEFGLQVGDKVEESFFTNGQFRINYDGKKRFGLIKTKSQNSWGAPFYNFILEQDGKVPFNCLLSQFEFQKKPYASQFESTQIDEENDKLNIKCETRAGFKDLYIYNIDDKTNAKFDFADTHYYFKNRTYKPNVFQTFTKDGKDVRAYVFGDVKLVGIDYITDYSVKYFVSGEQGDDTDYTIVFLISDLSKEKVYITHNGRSAATEELGKGLLKRIRYMRKCDVLW